MKDATGTPLTRTSSLPSNLPSIYSGSNSGKSSKTLISSVFGISPAQTVNAGILVLAFISKLLKN